MKDWITINGLNEMTTVIKTGIFKYGECAVFISIDGGRWHMSISHHNRLPTYEELKGARYKLLDDNLNMAMIFPPKAEFVNVHPYCLHLWQV